MRSASGTAGLALLMAASLAADPPVATPYEPDAATLHLWHLDEARPPFRDDAAEPAPLRGLLNGARAGRDALPGFDRSVSFHHAAPGPSSGPGLKGGILLASERLDNGGEDNIPPPFAFTGPDGAFTFEALIQPETMPGESEGIALGIMSMEGDGADRVFNFRIEKAGFLAFIPLNRIGAAGGCLAPIPTTGPHAINTRDWFHVAVTYDGREGESGNLIFYWTRIQPGLASAHRIGRATLAADLPNTLGDFAIGNEARAFPGNAEAEPFPGRLDEVRISGVARHPTDFAFVPPDQRRAPGSETASEGDDDAAPFRIRLSDVSVDGEPVGHDGSDGPLELSPGLHRLDFDFRMSPDSSGGRTRIRHQLAGLDDRWQVSVQGMRLTAEILDGNGGVMTASEFPAEGTAPGWNTTLDDSEPGPRTEALFAPPGAAAIRIRIDSGAPDTTGLMIVDDLDVVLPRTGGTAESFWFNSDFSRGENMSTSSGRPTGWHRRGSNPAIARLTIETDDPALALVDADRRHAASWIASAPLPPSKNARTFILKWRETYNIVGGGLHRASYVNVPPGEYTFRAVAPSRDGLDAASLAVPLVIRPPFWERGWFAPLVTAGAVGTLALLAYSAVRRRERRRLRQLELQRVLADDRARIARDMHDDLGTRITMMTLNTALIEREIGDAPARVRDHLARLKSSARHLVSAMDDLVWSVDPSNDSLERLAAFIRRTAGELFQNTAVRCRLDIPPVLPEIPLRSDVRHHLALAVKECLHNILRHAGPCEAGVRLRCDGATLRLHITDHGRGFAASDAGSGNGLANIRKRLEEIGGSCEMKSKPGAGTTVTLTLPLRNEPDVHDRDHPHPRHR